MSTWNRQTERECLRQCQAVQTASIVRMRFFKVGCASSVSQLFVSMRLVRAVRGAAAVLQDWLCWAGARRYVGQCLKVDYWGFEEKVSGIILSFKNSHRRFVWRRGVVVVSGRKALSSRKLECWCYWCLGFSTDHHCRWYQLTIAINASRDVLKFIRYFIHYKSDKIHFFMENGNITIICSLSWNCCCLYRQSIDIDLFFERRLFKE